MRIYKQAETFALVLAAGPPIEWTPEQQKKRRRLKEELLRREQAGEIGPLDATNPQSMTDANRAMADLYPVRSSHARAS